MNQISEKTMTFEEFRNSLFIPPSKRNDEEFCLYHYNRYLQQEEREKQSRLDDDFFEPVNEEKSAEIVKIYGEKLREQFGIQEMKNGELAFMIVPSFEPEKILFLRKGLLSKKILFRTFKKNFWGELYSGNRDVEKENYSFSLNKHQFLTLNDCLNRHFLKARPAKTEKWILDGVKYYILKMENRDIKAVYKHSPYEKSETGILVEKLEKLADDIQKNEGRQPILFPDMT